MIRCFCLGIGTQLWPFSSPFRVDLASILALVSQLSVPWAGWPSLDACCSSLVISRRQGLRCAMFSICLLWWLFGGFGLLCTLRQANFKRMAARFWRCLFLAALTVSEACSRLHGALSSHDGIFAMSAPLSRSIPLVSRRRALSPVWS